ncbi:hypothetical protein PYW08_013782 [Mythimna loreyi]|uniref:Uncharacterized protein n=1 Tax=Mythimna loreyi TaxID=667449 RepID=A0ACC2R5Q2_9NEOP|nr:hypothetical protein PYW08_013782 [Mythimna loreyi]
MAGVQRTPPKTAKTPNISQTQSEPDLNAAIEESEYVTNRNKRPRTEHSPQGQQGVNDSLANWKRDQDARITKLLEDQTTFMSKLFTDISEIKSQNIKIQESNAEIRKTNGDIERSISFINQQFEDLKREVEDLKKERQEQRKYVECLEKKIIDLQMKSRSSAIEIRNIPQSDMETTAALIKTVCSIGNVVGKPIPETEIRDVYRLPGKSTKDTAASTPRPIIAEFTKVQTKQDILSAVRSYNNKKSKENKINSELIGIPGNRRPVYIAEQLSSSSKKLFYLAREFAIKHNFMFCWVSNGNIFLRKQTGDKQIIINSEKCLQNIITK